MRNRKVLVVVLKKKMLLSIWTNPRIAFLEVAKTMKSNQLLCGRGIPCKDEGFERENSLTPILLTIFIFYKLCVHKNYGMGICFACISYYILVRVVGIIHLQ